MIITITGKLVRVGETAVAIEAAPFEYEVLVADYTRRQLQSRIGDETRLHTLDYIEGNPQGGRLTPRLIGFLTEPERQFFDLFCSVDGVGVKKALRAMVRPVKELSCIDRRTRCQRAVHSAGHRPRHQRTRDCQTTPQNAAIRIDGPARWCG